MIGTGEAAVTSASEAKPAVGCSIVDTSISQARYDLASALDVAVSWLASMRSVTPEPSSRRSPAPAGCRAQHPRRP